MRWVSLGGCWHEFLLVILVVVVVFFFFFFGKFCGCCWYWVWWFFFNGFWWLARWWRGGGYCDYGGGCWLVPCWVCLVVAGFFFLVLWLGLLGDCGSGFS